MKKYLHSIIHHPLISSSSIIFIGSFAANIINFVFNQQMAVRLSVTEYGILSSVLALINLPGFALGAVGTAIVAFVAGMFAKDELGKVKSFFFHIYYVAVSVAIITTVIFIIFAQPMSNFFHIQSIVILYIGFFIVIVSFFSIINQAFLQAKLSFGYIASINFISSCMKLGCGLLAVVFGLGVSGVFAGMLIAYFFAYVTTYIPMLFIFKTKRLPYEVPKKAIIGYGIKASLALMGLTAFISSDIILVKHFLSPIEAGNYAALSLVGRVIFYFTAPIGLVMFPHIIQRKEKNENYLNTLYLSFLLVIIPCVVITLVYWFQPAFVIKLFLHKDEYLTLAPVLGYFGILMVLFTLLNVLTSFYLSIKKTIVFIPIIIAAIIQYSILYMYHTSFIQIITVTIVIESILFIFLALSYKYIIKRF